MVTAIKTVLVTGAAKRLGRAIALDLAAHGWSVAVHYNSSRSQAEKTVDDIRAMGGRATGERATGIRAAPVQADLGDEMDTQGLIGRAQEALGPLTALVNNASLFEHDDIETITGESWHRHMNTNLYAPLLLARAFAKQVPQDTEGAIVNLLDQRLLKPTPQFLSYSVSKAGLHWLTKTLAQALAPRIRVNAVAPGPTLRSARQSEAQFVRQTTATILGRGASPEDVAAAVRYLLEARAVTGQTLVVDGGQHLIWRTEDVSVEV